jgi:hypothetical protein
MDNAADIIQTALDNMGREVELVIAARSDVFVRRATVTGVTSTTMPGLMVTDYSYADGEVITDRTFVSISEIISISPVS